MKVVIHGPNLNDQRKGQFHVHTADCQDNKHYGPGKKFGGETGWEVEAKTEYDVSFFVYEDHLSDYGYAPDSKEGRQFIENCLSDFWFAPCVKDLKRFVFS